jgi:hypothetical protein
MLWLFEAVAKVPHDGHIPTPEAVADAMAQAHGLFADQVLAWMHSCALLAGLTSAPFHPSDSA